MWLSQDIWTQVSHSANVNKTGQFSQHRWPGLCPPLLLRSENLILEAWLWRLKSASAACKLFLQSHWCKLWEQQSQPESKLSLPKHTRTTREILWCKTWECSGPASPAPSLVSPKMGISPCLVWYSPACLHCKAPALMPWIFTQQRDELFESLHEIVKQIV